MEQQYFNFFYSIILYIWLHKTIYQRLMMFLELLDPNFNPGLWQTLIHSLQASTKSKVSSLLANFYLHIQLIKVHDLPANGLPISYHLLELGSDKERHFEMYTCEIEEPGFRSYHERLQTFLLWYVDAASFIDVDDDRWRFYLVWVSTLVQSKSWFFIWLKQLTYLNLEPVDHWTIWF